MCVCMSVCVSVCVCVCVCVCALLHTESKVFEITGWRGLMLLAKLEGEL